MKFLLAIPLVALAAGCSGALPQVPPGGRLVEIADAIRHDLAWKSEAERDEAIRFLCAGAGRAHVDALFLLLERGDARPALQATAALAPLLTADDLPSVDRLLSGSDGSRVARALILLREARLGAAAPLLEKRAKEFLDPKRKDVARVALGTFGVLGLRGTTPAILSYLDLEQADDSAAFRALGRLWERRLDASPLDASDERTRLSVLVLVHRLTMAAADPDAAEAALRLMTRAELNDFLGKHAGDRFPARHVLAAVCSQRDFDPKKGALVHKALLGNPDVSLVALLLWSSPHALEAKAVGALLGNEEAVKEEDLPAARLCDYAAARLEAESVRRKMEIPTAAGERDALLKKWRERKPR